MRITRIGDLEFMGDRRNIRVEFPSGNAVYLYSHWGGSALETVLARALKRGKPRWEDPSYLTRIVFNEMTKGVEMEEVGYGISPTRDDWDSPDIVLTWGEWGGGLFVILEPDMDLIPVEQYVKRYKV